MAQEKLLIFEFDESPIPNGCRRHIEEVQIRKDGCIWIIHRNDADPFPSNPHAHNKESRLKLDLGNGKLFLHREFTGQRIKHKHLMEIRSEAEKKGIQLPPLS